LAYDLEENEISRFELTYIFLIRRSGQSDLPKRVYFFKRLIH